jgi:drug/metabolite transporter (DMT)-like permease
VNRTKAFFIGIGICLAGAICFSTKAVLVKMAYRDVQLDAVTLLALRMLFALPFFLLSAFFSYKNDSKERLKPKLLLLIALAGCLGYYISSLFDFLGLRYVSAGIERLILFMYPTLVLLISRLLFKQKIEAVQWLAVMVTYLGLALAFIHEVQIQHASRQFMIGTAYILVCAFTYAGYIVASGRLIPKVGASRFNSYAMMFACFAVLLHFFATSKTSLIHLEKEAYVYGFLMAVISTVVPSYLVTEGIKRVGASNAAIIGSIGPISTILQANLLLNEPFTSVQAVGTSLILAGVLLISLRK